MKPTHTFEGNISTGIQYEWELDLSKKDFSRQLVIDALGFAFGSITIQTVKATGTSGTVICMQGNQLNQLVAISDKSQGISANSAWNIVDVVVSCRYFVVDLTSATLGSVGKIIISATLKRSGGDTSSPLTFNNTLNVKTYIDQFYPGSVTVDESSTTGAHNPSYSGWVSVENIGAANGTITFTGSGSGTLTLAPGEKWFDEMKVYKGTYNYETAAFDFDATGTTFRIMKKIIIS